MTEFKTEEELAAWLKKLNSQYEKYASSLWRGGVTNTSILATADKADLCNLGILPLHATNIKEFAGAPPPSAPSGGTDAGKQLDIQALLPEIVLQLKEYIRTDAGHSSVTYVNFYNYKKPRLTENVVNPMTDDPMPQHASQQQGTAMPAALKNALKGVNSGAVVRENEDMLPILIKAVKHATTAQKRVAQNKETLVGNAMRPYIATKVANLQFVDTHTFKFLGGGAPDLAHYDSTYALTAFTLLAFCELQSGALDNVHKGKALFYLDEMMLANPDRVWASGVLTNLIHFIYYTAVRHNGEIRYYASPPYSLQSDKGWGMFVAFCNRDARQCGFVVPDFSCIPGLKVTGHLGTSRQVQVWEASFEGDQVAVKQYLREAGDAAAWARKDSYEREVKALQILDGTHDDFFPELVHHDEPHGLIVTRPVGKPAEVMTRARLRKVVQGIRRLHGKGYVFRDLEPKHLLAPLGQEESGDAIFLVDFSTAIKLGETYRDGYAGTLGYASDDVLLWFATNPGVMLPARWQQDLVALVKTVYVLLHRAAHAAFQTKLRELEHLASMRQRAAAVRDFWDQEFRNEAGDEWQRLVKLAHVDGVGASVDEHNKAFDEMTKIDAAYASSSVGYGGNDMIVDDDGDNDVHDDDEDDDDDNDNATVTDRHYHLVIDMLERALARHLRAGS